jgi:hypothetical protein
MHDLRSAGHSNRETACLAGNVKTLRVSKKDLPSDDVLEFLRKIGRKGGQARAKKYDTKIFSKWSKESRAGRPPKHKRKE